MTDRRERPAQAIRNRVGPEPLLEPLSILLALPVQEVERDRGEERRGAEGVVRQAGQDGQTVA